MIYLDHAATTNIYDHVLELYTRSLKEDFANPSSAHALGRKLTEKLKNLRLNFLKELGGKSNDHFYFLSSATEGNNTVIRGINFSEGDAVIYSKADHKSVTENVEKGLSKNIEKIHINFLNENWREELSGTDSIKLIILSLVNNQSGSILKINEIAKELKLLYPKSHIHVDAVQGIGKIKYQVTSDIDSLVLTSHKFGGPKGIAGLFLKQGHKVAPFLIGGGQQDNFRSSTESYPLSLAFHEAFVYSNANTEINFDRIAKLQSHLKSEILKVVPSAIFPFENVSPYITCFIIPKISSDILIRHLESKQVYIASTSACSSKIKGYNSTMDALGIEEKYHKNVLRISMGTLTTEKDVNEFCLIFKVMWNDIAHLVR